MSDLVLELRSTPDAALEARLAIRERFAESLPAPTLYDLLTVATELVSNAVHHGPGTTIRMQLEQRGDGSMRGEIDDGGHGPVSPKPVSSSLDRGLGLHIVDAIAARWGVERGSSRVWFELAPL